MLGNVGTIGKLDYKAREGDRNQVHSRLCQEFGFYSNYKVKQLEDYKDGKYII